MIIINSLWCGVWNGLGNSVACVLPVVMVREQTSLFALLILSSYINNSKICSIPPWHSWSSPERFAAPWSLHRGLDTQPGNDWGHLMGWAGEKNIAGEQKIKGMRQYWNLWNNNKNTANIKYKSSIKLQFKPKCWLGGSLMESEGSPKWLDVILLGVYAKFHNNWINTIKMYNFC